MDQSKWYHEAIDFVVSQNLMRGMSDTLFQPDGNMTRAQMVTVLYRLADTPTVEGASLHRCEGRSILLRRLGLGLRKRHCQGHDRPAVCPPHTSVTREQMVVFFARFAQLNGQTVEGEKRGKRQHLRTRPPTTPAPEHLPGGGEGPHPGGPPTPPLGPKATSTRAQIAEVLLRYCTIFG